MYIFAMYDINGKHFLLDRNTDKPLHFATPEEAKIYGKEKAGFTDEEIEHYLEEITTIEDVNEILYGEFGKEN
jgi:hypothetical protein